MQWIVSAAAFVILIFLVFKARRPSDIGKADAVLEEALDAHIHAAARNAEGRGFLRISIPKSFLSALESSIGFLCTIPVEECLPAARSLRENARFLQEEAASVLVEQRKLPKLPAVYAKEVRLLRFVHAFLDHQTGSVTQKELHEAVQAWQSVIPLTHDELFSLSFAIRAALLSRLVHLSRTCASDHRAQQAARHVHRCEKHGHLRKARRIFQKFQNHPAFLEGLSGLAETGSWADEQLKAAGVPVEEIRSAQQAHQIDVAQWIQNTVSSLHTVRRIPWERLCEEWSLPHAVFMQDPIYANMDAESRYHYRKANSRLARVYAAEEETVAQTILSLCKAAQPGSIKAHCGWYLIDDGCFSLPLHLQCPTPAARVSLFIHHHAVGLERLFSWLIFLLLILLCWKTQLPVLAWLPFGLFFVLLFRPLLHSFLFRQNTDGFLPSMQLDQLTADARTLVVCPAVLTSKGDAIQAVKKLSIEHEANPDQHLHFLLMGDFADSLSASAATDAEITEAAFTAIHALCEDTQHPFFYLQRGRVSSPDNAVWHSRERKRGSLLTALKLVEGHPVEDPIVCSSIEPAMLKEQYRYVILLDSDTRMPPGSVLHMVGAMLHPLNRRQKVDHHMHGVSIIQPRMETSLHTVKTPFGEIMHHAGNLKRAVFDGTGIIDPSAFLEAAGQSLDPAFVLGYELLSGELAGCAHAGSIVLYTQSAQTLKAFLSSLHRRTRGEWQLLPCLLSNPLSRSAQLRLGLHERSRIWHILLSSLLPPIRLCLLLYALCAGNGWLWTSVFVLPFLTSWSFSLSSLKKQLLRTALLPCEAFAEIDAILRALYRLLFSRSHLQDEDSSQPVEKPKTKPSLLLFTLTLGFAGSCAAIALIPGAFHAGCWATAFLWIVFALGMPFLNQEYHTNQKPTFYMQEVLLRLARQTFSFFEAAVTPKSSHLPPETLQLDPAKGPSQHSTPSDIGFYLCSMIAAEKLQLLKPEAMLERIRATLCTLEKLPKWNGLFYSCYHTRTLQPIRADDISSAGCGILAVSLLTCAQGIRALMPKLDSSAAETAARLDQLVHQMQLERLYDAQAELFHTGVNPLTETPSDELFHLLASESRLLSFVSIALGRVPLRHWYRLERSCTRRYALLSSFGSLSEYLTPVLFQPLIRGTLLKVSAASAVRAQQKHRLGGAFGISRSGCYSFDSDLNYRSHPFGIPELALHADVQHNVLTPYAALLALHEDLKGAFRSLLGLEILGLQGPMGLFEAADFNPSHTEGESMKIVRSHQSGHQGMILCAICNALEGHYIASLFSALPRVQAFEFLLEEQPVFRRSAVRRTLKTPPKDHSSPPQQFERPAHPLCFPIDAHLLSGAGTSWVIDAQGGGRLAHHGTPLSRFEESCHVPSGMRFYLRDSQSGAFWLPTDPYLVDSVQFETSEVIFSHIRFDIACELRMWVDPLDGSAVAQIALENRSASERVMEVCSYLDPALSSGKMLRMRTQKLSRNGIAASVFPSEESKSEYTLCHLLQADAELSLTRLQTDRFAFLGRGRSFHAPRALEYAIGAVADSLGDMTAPCLSIRGQFRLPAGEKITLHFATRMVSSDEKPSAFTERFATAELFSRSRAAAATRGVVNTRFHHLSAGEQASLSRLTGALLYTGQPFQSYAASLPADEMQKRFGISSNMPLLLLECSGGISQPLLSLLIKGHMFFGENGFPFAMAITVRGKRRLASLTEEIESLFAQNHSAKRNVFVIRQPSEEETGLLRSCARLVLQDTEFLENQLDALLCSVRVKPLFTCRSAAANQSSLPSSDPAVLFNGFGGFTPAEGNYQIALAPGMQTPAPWRNPLCNETFGTLADESGILFNYAVHGKAKHLMRAAGDAVSSRGDETVYLQDIHQGLLWSITRQPLGHGMPVRITHAPGETLYESCVHGIYSRLHCFTDAELAMGIRIIQIKNEDTSNRTLRVIHSCIFSNSVHLRCETGCVCGPAEGNEGWLWFGGLGPCASAAMSSGEFQGLWSSAPFALTHLEHLPAGEGNACAVTFDVPLAPGESRTFATAVAYDDTITSVQEAVLQLRSQGASRRLHLLRQHWSDFLGAMQFDLPDQALSILLSRWLPYQICNAAFWRKAEVEPFTKSAKESDVFTAHVPEIAESFFPWHLQIIDDLPGNPPDSSLTQVGIQSAIAACLAASALHQLGEDERAWALAIRMSPIARSASRQLALRSRTEPYLISESTHSQSTNGSVWYDNSAAWYFALLFQQLLGLRKSGETLCFSPTAPSVWDTLRITLRYGASTYHLHASRQCASPSADGETLQDGMLPLVDDGRIHEAFFPLR